MTLHSASLHRRLIWRLMPALFGAIALVGITAYFVGKRSADFAYDQALSAAAADIAGGVRVDGGNASFDLSAQSERILRSDVRDDIYFAVHLADGQFVGGDKDLVDTKPALDTEGTSRDLSFRQQIVRAMSIRFAQTGIPFVVTVAETTRKRQAAAWAIFAQLMVPTTLVLTLACLIVWFSVRGGLQPLDELQVEIEARSELDLSPIAAVGAPFEVRSLVHALNRLLARLDAATRAHQSFVADAAHQLRTPLAGLQTQLDLLAVNAQADPGPMLERMRLSVDRATRMVNQLLALARSEKDATTLRLKAFNLAELVAQGADTWVHRAITAQIDLGFDLTTARLVGDPYLVRELIENLIDNALLYTPQGGNITVGTRTTDDAVELSVDDSGPGVPDALRETIFERFYRQSDCSGTGSGLGLAIVREIALRHDGVATAERSTALGGLRVLIRFPSQGPAATGR
jgi:two-component system sensor histidine kinase TctE